MPKYVIGIPRGARGENRSQHALLCPPHVCHVMYAPIPLHKVKKFKMNYFSFKKKGFEHTWTVEMLWLGCEIVHGLKLLVSN